MKQIRTLLRSSRSGDRGSALLVSLMVMVGLSLLGLGFVAISETESTISINERNAVQTLHVAEAGARTVVEWFNNPKWALENGLMPVNANGIKRERRSTYLVSGGGTTTAVYTGWYKPKIDDGDPTTTDEILFDLPYKPGNDHRFFGVDEASADVRINRDTAAAFLDTFNQRLFNGADAGGRVIEILIYAPPVLNPLSPATTTYNGGRFWNGGTRYGVATIKVTAEKTNPANCRFGVDTPCQLLARRAVKMVVAEFPFPGPEGPLQSQTGIATAGVFVVHWGKMISLGNLGLAREYTSIPWRDATNQIAWEYGYANNTWPATPTAGATQPPYFYELLNKSFQDPWFQARARGDITSDGGLTADIAARYDSIDDQENATGFTASVAGWSNQMQNQDRDNGSTRKNVLFPRIEYRFWKQIAQSATGQQGIYYLQFVPGTETFRDRSGQAKTFRQWVDTLTGGKEGFYFFDTRDGTNPQRPDGTTITEKLTPIIAEQGNDLHMKGFVYLNALVFGTTGLGGRPGFYNAPGEPFRDIGYHEVDVTNGQLLYHPGPIPKLVNFTNYQWDFQDLPLTTAAGGTFSATGVRNGKFDYFVRQETVTRVGTDNAGSITEYVIVPYSDGCNVGVECSEPHEPYLNIIYPTEFAKENQTAVNTYLVRWQASGSQTRQPKVFQADGVTRFDCTTGTPTPEQCTSNGYDDLGPLLRLGHQAGDGPILDGVFYNEGGYNAAGNATYYGSVVIRGPVTGSGNPDVWFDYRLTRADKWQERFKNLARVIITSHETDQ